jgi:hypothetical protein
MFYLALSVSKIIALLCVNEIFINTERWWNDTDRTKHKFSEKSLSQYYVVHHKSKKGWPGIEPSLHGKRP